MRKGKALKKRWSRDDTELFLLSLPTLIWYAIFAYLPMFGIIIAFKVYRLQPGRHGFIYNLLHSEWAGFGNFSFFFTSDAFAMLLRNTILYNIVFIIISASVAVGGALMLSNAQQRRVQSISDDDVSAVLYVMGSCYILRICDPDAGKRLFERYYPGNGRRRNPVVSRSEILAVYSCAFEHMERYGLRHGAVSGQHYRY